MDPLLIGTIMIVALVVLLLLGVHVFVAMGLTGFLGFWWVTGNLEGTVVLTGGTAFSVGSSYDFSIMPLFILLGMSIYESGMALRIYDALYAWVGRIPAGLAIATTIAVAFFSAVSGSPMACAVTFSKIAFPEMVKRGYRKGLAGGLIAGASTQDALIPPSGLLVLYAILTDQSIGKCLMAGLLPGMLSIGLYIVLLIGMAIVKPEWMPRGRTFTTKEKFSALKGAWEIPLLAVLILGAIYTGICTPTEAAAVGTFMAILLGVIVVGIKKMRLPAGLRSTVTATVMIYAILVGAFIFSSFATVAQIPTALSELVRELALSKAMVIFFLVILYTILDVFMTPAAFVVVSMPIVFPIVKSIGLDPIWFGIFVAKMAGIGNLTPPIAMCVYAVKATLGDQVKIGELFKGSIPFWIMDLICLLMISLWPQIVTVVPNMMGK